MLKKEAPSPRFVLLEHTTHSGVHWDLLVELPDQQRLASWRLAADPTRGAFPIPAEPMTPHRKAYLDYEGPMSGDRGVVRRIDRGKATATRSENDRATLELNGARIAGRFVIMLVGNDRVLDRTG
jgi:hypothetical protein